VLLLRSLRQESRQTGGVKKSVVSPIQGCYRGLYNGKYPPPGGGGEYQPMSFGGKNIIFRRGGGINIVFGPKYRPLGCYWVKSAISRGVTASGISSSQRCHYDSHHFRMSSRRPSPNQGYHCVMGINELGLSAKQGCLWVRDTCKSRMSVSEGCLWVMGVCEWGMSMSQGKAWVRDVCESKKSVREGCLWVRVSMSWQVICELGCLRARLSSRGVQESGMSVNKGVLWFRFVLRISDVCISLSQRYR
jgi:hypothetical protein